MSIREAVKEKLYNRIADYLSVARGYFIASLYGPSWARKLARAEEDLRERMKSDLVRLREAFLRADIFLKKFRENRPDWAYSAQEKRPFNPHCKHTKGSRIRGPVTDYNVAAHTFSNSKTKIWCLNGCGFESYPGDVNWKKATDMMEQTTNHPSASERFLYVNKTEPIAITRVVYQDKI